MDGVLPNDFLAKPVLVASDGNIYMGGSEGLVRINKALKSASIPPPITLELQEVSLNGTIVPFNSQSTMEIPYKFLLSTNTYTTRRRKCFSQAYISVPHKRVK